MLRSKSSAGEGRLATGMLAGLAGGVSFQTFRGRKGVVALLTTGAEIARAQLFEVDRVKMKMPR